MSVMKLGIVFDVKNDKFKSEVKESTVAIENFSRSAKGAGSATLRLSNNTQRADVQNQQFAKSLNTSSTALATTTKHAHAAHGSITDMVKSMMIMSAVMGTVGLGAKLVTDLATFQDLRVRLRGLSDSTVDYADKESFLISLAKEHHKELTGLASGYAGLSVMVKENIINDEQARLMLEGLSNAASETGADAANLKQVLYGLNQVLGQGTVQAQELSQVVEPMPGLLSKLARAAGQETGAAFRKLVGEGKVTSEMFAKYMVTALNEYDGAAAKTANNINAKFANVSTAYLLLAKNLEQPINNALLPVLDVLTAGLISLSENTDTVSNVVFGSFALAMAHAVNALSNKAAAIVKDTVATRASNQANLMLTKSELAQAQLANQRAIQEQAAAQRMLKNAQNTTIRSKAITNLARANGQLAASEKLVALATNNVAIATNKANTARRAGAAALGLLGGPAGVAMLAAYAIGSYAMSAADAARESVNLAEKIGLADKKLTELTTKQLSLRLFNLENDPAAEIDKARLRTLKAQEEYNRVQAARGFKNPNKETDKTVLNRDVEIEALEAKFAKTKELKDKINELLAAPVSSEPKPKAGQDNNSLDVFAQQEEALSRQLALLGETTQLANAEYETTLGKYKDLLPGQKASLLNLAQEIDAKNKALTADKESVNQAKELKSTADSYANSLQRKAELTSESSNVAQLNYEIEHGSLKGINDELRTQLELLAQKADATAALGEQQLPFWQQMKEHISSTSQDFDTMWGNTFNSFAQNMGDAVSTSIMEGQNFGDTMRNIARSAIKEVISGLVQIGVKKLALSAIEKVIGTTGAATNVALAATTGTAMAASYAPAAAFASLASFGANAVPASAGIATTFALTEGLALAGMAHDGIDEIPSEGTWLLDKGERVVDNRTNQDLKQYLNNSQSGGSAPIIYLTNKITIEGNGNSNADIESAINLSTEKMRADLYEDFSTNGALTQQLKAAM